MQDPSSHFLQVLALTCLACAGTTSCSSTERAEPFRKSPYLTIDDGVIRFEGQELPLGSEWIEAWEEVLGPSRSEYGEGHVGGWHVWDEHGFSVQFIRFRPQVPRQFVTSFRIHFEPHQDFGPEKMFEGTLLLDGTRVHRDMKQFPKDKPCRFVTGKPFYFSYTCTRFPYGYAFHINPDLSLVHFSTSIDMGANHTLWTTGELPPLAPPSRTPSWWPSWLPEW